MAETTKKERLKIAPSRTALIWEGKYDQNGRPRTVERIALPFQVVETINQSRATQWCWNASAIAGVTWQYVKVPYNLFEASSATTFAELVAEIVVKTGSTMGQRV